MSNYKYKDIVNKAKSCQSNVKKHYKLGESYRWSYYFAKSILSPKKDIKKLELKDCKNPSGTHISRQIGKADYLDICKRYVKYVESNKQFPIYVTYKNYQIRPRLLTEFLSRILVYYDKHGKLPSEANINDKVFTVQHESKNKVYLYFCKVFGKVNSIDEALQKVKDKGYDYYYDDRYSNIESINRIKKGLGINCTDSCHVFYNIVSALIELGKYKKVECLHVQCQSGGHVKLRITLKDGSRIIRDPACVLSKNGKPITCKWCTDSGNVNPSWFMEDLNR